MFILAIGDLPESWVSVLGLPALIAILAAAIWVAGRISQVKNHAWSWKWFAAPLFLIAIALGIQTCLRMRDFLYRDAIEPLGTKIAVAHYAALAIPVLLIVVVAVWEAFERQRVDQEF